MKKYITAKELLIDSYKLADKICQDGFKPQFIVGVWRGGTPVGIAIQEYLEYNGVKSDHISVRTSSYIGIGKQSNEIKVDGLQYIVDNINHNDSLLIVDDVYDTGRSVDTLIKNIRKLCRANCPKDIRIACPWYKPKNKRVNLPIDYYLYETEKWLVFPHELDGLSKEEIINGKKDLEEIIYLFK